MKKTLSIIAIMVIGLVMVLPFSVFAETENDVINKISTPVTINGRTVSVRSDVINEAKRYLTAYDLTEAECKIICDNIDAAINKAKEEGATKWKELSAEGKNAMIGFLENVTSGTTINATLTSDGTLTIYTPDGNEVFTKITDAVVDSGSKSGVKAVNTGVKSIAVVIIALVAAAGCVVVSRNVSKASA